MTDIMQEHELGWDDEIQKESDFVLLPERDYNFTVKSFERGRHPGSEKLPPCNKASITLTIHSPEHGDVDIFHNIFLHTKTEGMISAFFIGIGQKKKGEKLRMNWNAVVGAKGRVKIGINKYRTQKGEERTNNQVVKFYEPESPQADSFTPGQF